ncbi:MAG: hypothetical protein NT003_02300 [Candidatus Magasanikbacteria bacterium]|nr:hypothetical protein [Candidatus Magasanikbacteria bacterium]
MNKKAPSSSVFFALLSTGVFSLAAITTIMFVKAATPPQVATQAVQPKISQLSVAVKNADGSSDTYLVPSMTPTTTPLVIQYKPGQTGVSLNVALTSQAYAVPTYVHYSYIAESNDYNLAVLKDNILNNKQGLLDPATSDWSPNLFSSSNQMSKALWGKKWLIAVYVKNNDPISASSVGSGVDDVDFFLVQFPQDPDVNAGKLYVSSGTAFPGPFIMGDTNNSLFSFNLTATGTDDIKVNQLTVAFAANGSKLVMPMGAIKNIKLFDGNTQIGMTVPAAITKNSTPAVKTQATGYATFNGLNLTIPKGTKKLLTVKVDWASAPSAFSGTQIRAHINDAPYNLSKDSSILAVDAVTGENAIINGTAGMAPVSVYQTNIVAALMTSSPAGPSYANPEQIITKFALAAAANTNNIPVTVNSLHLILQTTIKQPAKSTRVMNIYKGEVPMKSALLATYNLTAAGAMGKTLPFIKMGFAQPLIIGAGTNQVLTVTLNTTDAKANDTLSVGLSKDGFKWTDGVTSFLSLPIDAALIAGKTLAF